MNKPELSVIIVSWRVKDLLRQCLKSIFNNTAGLDFEVIVVDNDSGDGSVEMVEQNFPQVKVIAARFNLGFARANNLALKQSVGKYLLLLNPDTKIIDNSLKKTVDYLNSHPRAGVLGGKLLNHDLSFQPSVRRFPRFVDHLIMMFKLHHLLPLKSYLAQDFDYTKVSEVDQVTGAYFAISRAAYDKAGPLDEKYYIWFEEVDYCQRVKKAGFKVVYYPEVSAIHYGGQSFKQVFNLKKQWIYNKSRLRYIAKHESPLVYIIILILSPVSLLLSALSFKYVR
ncbi:MAG TPA: glycosyltransferase family 2 protein [Patescibacteria group bacterium]|nr:glycosyltransferase family 2 protein [Patescibacteria group bacterium]